MRELHIVGTGAYGAPNSRQIKDKRAGRRIPLSPLGLEATLYPAGPSNAAIPGRLVNLSAGGCSMAVASRTAGALAEGLHGIVDLPAGRQGLQYPATLVGMEPLAGAASQLLLRLRFRKADPATQQRLTRWIGELAVTAWHS